MIVAQGTIGSRTLRVANYFTQQYKALPGWQSRRQNQFISTGKLTIQVGGAYGLSAGRQLRFSDTRAHQLEEVLSGVVREVEMRFLERQQEQAEAQREELEQQERWERVLDVAERRAVEAHRAEVLAQRASAWREWQDQVKYVDELESLIHAPTPSARQLRNGSVGLA